MVEESEQKASGLPQDAREQGVHLPAAPRRRGNPVWGWLWQGGKARELKERLAKRSQASRIAMERSHASLAAANVLSGGGAEGAPAAGPLLADFYLQAIHWGLVGLESPPQGSDGAVGPATLADVRSQLRGLNVEALARAETVYAAWRDLSWTELWDEASSPDDIRALAGLAEAVVELVERPVCELDNIWFVRLLRLAVPFALLLAAGLAGGMVVHRSTVLKETSFPWRASSRFTAEKGCESPQQECAETRFFFCTSDEKDPWIEFDLGKGGHVSRVIAKNRTDCPECAPRAVPLVIEVSTDRKAWKEVARRTTTFEEWKATFPREQAQWVRLRALKRTYLHLQQVRIAD